MVAHDTRLVMICAQQRKVVRALARLIGLLRHGDPVRTMSPLSKTLHSTIANRGVAKSP